MSAKINPIIDQFISQSKQIRAESQRIMDELKAECKAEVEPVAQNYFEREFVKAWEKGTPESMLSLVLNDPLVDFKSVSSAFVQKNADKIQSVTKIENAFRSVAADITKTPQGTFSGVGWVKEQLQTAYVIKLESLIASVEKKSPAIEQLKQDLKSFEANELKPFIRAVDEAIERDPIATAEIIHQLLRPDHLEKSINKARETHTAMKKSKYNGSGWLGPNLFKLPAIAYLPAFSPKAIIQSSQKGALSIEQATERLKEIAASKPYPTSPSSTKEKRPDLSILKFYVKDVFLVWVKNVVEAGFKLTGKIGRISPNPNGTDLSLPEAIGFFYSHNGLDGAKMSRLKRVHKVLPEIIDFAREHGASPVDKIAPEHWQKLKSLIRDVGSIEYTDDRMMKSATARIDAIVKNHTQVQEVKKKPSRSKKA